MIDIANILKYDEHFTDVFSFNCTTVVYSIRNVPLFFNENGKARVIVQHVSPLSSPFQYDDNNDDNGEDKYYGSQRSSYSRDVVWC